MKIRDGWMWAAGFLLCTTLAASLAAFNYYNQAEAYRRDYEELLRELESLTIIVNLKIDYGNGTVLWYNKTRLPLDSNLFNSTMKVAMVEYIIGEYGVFVTKINGVGGDPNRFWLWYYLDPDKEEWILGPVACDRWKLRNGSILAWVYSSL
ncbi:hypothetical protein KEJ34_06675 [Candidatus Bathyarchaeota archaeon]|nr:hypothetical protein [Candidatus Bathyarchaeota archaeon]